MKERKAIVVGAGLVGSLLTILLAKRGYQVAVYEKRPDMRAAGFVGGRSINLALSDRGWKALQLAGIAEDIKAISIPMSGRMMHDINGKHTPQPYGKEGQAIYSVSRGELNLKLLDLADQFPNVSLNFDQGSTGFDLLNNEVQLENETVSAPLIFGTDGAFSAVRSSMQRLPRFNYSQYYLQDGYKELHIPPGPGGTHQLEKNALHIWPRGKFMLIALPNEDGSFTCTLFLPFEGKESFEQLQTPEDILAFFKKFFPDTVPLMPDLVQVFQENPTSSLVTVRCSPWHHENKALLLGDAAHAIVPFYGQGMNSGFEDCTILYELLETFGDDWDRIMPLFSNSRPLDSNAIADLALRNFIEMRDLVGDPQFLLRKKIEAWLQDEFPKAFLPLYSMVTFSHLPYSLAWQEGQAQDELFEKILAIPGVNQNWKTEAVKTVFQEWMQERERNERIYAKPSEL
ncbi:MAG: FAD-dependent monooxygenase [Saprospiraceae bacterium]|nr:FAD-dependent monooxygenase [Saprospiraceae bacterium]